MQWVRRVRRRTIALLGALGESAPERHVRPADLGDHDEDVVGAYLAGLNKRTVDLGEQGLLDAVVPALEERDLEDEQVFAVGQPEMGRGVPEVSAGNSDSRWYRSSSGTPRTSTSALWMASTMALLASELRPSFMLILTSGTAACLSTSVADGTRDGRVRGC
jgi:hypothetical protein